MPSIYDRAIFSATRESAVMILEEVNARVTSLQPANTIGRDVKVGGGQRSGQYFIDTYISFKNKDKQKVALTLLQEASDSELRARVRRHDMAATTEPQDEIFSMDRFNEASDLFVKYVADLARV